MNAPLNKFIVTTLCLIGIALRAAGSGRSGSGARRRARGVSPARRAAGHQRSVSQHLVDGRPLTDDRTRHWTRHDHPLVSLIRIDGKSYRLMGDEPKDVPAMKQVGLQVLPTRTIYDFDDGHVHVTLTFMTPATARTTSTCSPGR